ncbi:MAG: hypothetical protein H0V97_05575 [Actinobacteria bacterium]|nr:hypothetical protein [Actinomycetota bacterium]
MTVTITTGRVCGSSTVSVTRGSVASSVEVEETRRIPLSIPKDQLYFWASDWQASERRADEDLAADRSKEYHNFMDLARDLLSAE